jgi:aflatoxin B1 aldehyde reductase
VGTSKSAQLKETLSAVEQGPLPESIGERANAIWEKVKHEAPLDNYNSFMALKK